MPRAGRRTGRASSWSIRPRSETADAPPANAPLAVKLLVSAGPLFDASVWIAPCTVLMPRLAISSEVSTVTGEATLSALVRNSVPVTTISLPLL